MSYIKREDAIMTAMNYKGSGNAQDASQDIASELTSIPAADVRENVRGEWEKVPRHPNSWRTYTGLDLITQEERTVIVREESEYEWLRCPYCKAAAADNYQNFCPNCGADMRGGNDGNSI